MALTGPKRMTSDPPIELVAAVARNGVIGSQNRLPWRLPEDMRRFRALTLGHPVIMGRKTWESLPRPLSDRQNLVITRRGDYTAKGAEVVTSLDEALARVVLPTPVFCIGGGEIYRLVLPRAAAVHLTAIEHDFPGDTTFPCLDPAEWLETSRETHEAAAADDYHYAFVTYRRRARA